MVSLLPCCSACSSQDLVMAAQLSLDHFLKSSNVLPHLKGSLSSVIPSEAIASANKEIIKAMRQSRHKNVAHIIGKCQSQGKKSTDTIYIIPLCFLLHRYSSPACAQIGSYVDIHGTSAASWYFTQKLGENVTKSSVQSIKKAYVRKKKKRDEELTDLPEMKRGHHCSWGTLLMPSYKCIWRRLETKEEL